MLSLVVTVVLLGLAASGPTFPVDPVMPVMGHSATKVITSPKVHREQVGLIHQEAVPVKQTQVVTNERVKVVTQNRPVLVPQTKVQKIIQQVPLQTVKKVLAPVLLKHKEIVPMIKERIKNVVHKIPQIRTNTVVRNVPTPIHVPKIHTKHVHHVRTKVVNKPIPSPYRVDNPVNVPKPFVQTAPAPVPITVVKPKYIDRVHTRTQTKLVPKHIHHTVVKPQIQVKTEYKTIHKNVPMPAPVPQHIVHTKHVKAPIPITQTVVQKQLVPKIIEKTRHHAVQVPIVKTNTVVKTRTLNRLIPKIFNRVHTVKERVPVPHKQIVVQKEPYAVPAPHAVEKIVNHVQQVPVIKNHVRTVHHTRVKEVPVPHTRDVYKPVIKTVPVPQLIVKETKKEILQPVKMATRSSVRYYQINSDGSRVAISPARVQLLLSNGAISRSQIQMVGGAQGAGIVGGATGAIHQITSGIRQRSGPRSYRIGNVGRYASHGTQGGAVGHMQQGIAGFGVHGPRIAGSAHAGIAGGMVGGNIGAINLQAAGGAAASHAALQAAAARQASMVHGASVLKKLNHPSMTSDHIYAKVAK